MKTASYHLFITLSMFCIFLSCIVRKPLEDECNSFKVTITQEGSDQLVANPENGLGPYEFKWSNGIGNLPRISVLESGVYSVTVTDLTNSCTANESYSFTKASGNGCGSFTAVNDAENNLYDIVTIGTQCWLMSNLNIETGIPKITDPMEWASATTPAWCYYNNDPANGPRYRKLYNWYAVNSGNLCPQGWHIPSMAEWETLFKHLKNDSLASIALRKIDPLWSGTIHASNESGFSALPAGRRQANGSFIFEGTETDFWSSDESSLAGSAKAITLKGSFDGISRIDWGKNHGFSCRCIKN
ncbi:MAG: fibrobacter succinogenes major paralogous domain-containing protein [Saprospiraceae bacterium]|nr:fibrobacter succinogenes major paralogous domain-containing protein [Candidatus Defluviibacterium haderslevense]